MALIRELSLSDLDDVREIANVYLSNFEVEKNRDMFTDACDGSIRDTLGYGAELESALRGFLIATVCPESDSLDRHFNRPTPVTAKSRSMILQHLYVRPDYRHRGCGTELMERILKRAESEGIEEVFAEAWIHPEIPDAIPLLETHEFTRLYHESDYWAHDDFVASDVPCPTHNSSYAVCPCEGAVYRRHLS